MTFDSTERVKPITLISAEELSENQQRFGKLTTGGVSALTRLATLGGHKESS